MREVTKREALELCVELWTWLADNPDKDKYDKAEELLGYESQTGCPACEYAKQNTSSADSSICQNCPIDSWRKGPTCTSSEYVQWLIARGEWFDNQLLFKDKEEQYYKDKISDSARKIAKLAASSLKRLEKSE